MLPKNLKHPTVYDIYHISSKANFKINEIQVKLVKVNVLVCTGI